MKRAKHSPITSKKLTSVPELPYKKGLLISSPKPKEKHNATSAQDKIEPMVLRSPPTGESIVRFALPIPLSNTKNLISEAEMVRRTANNLKMVVSTLEETYGNLNQDREIGAVKPEAEGLSVGDDVNSFLLCCLEFTAQLEEAVKEECNVLESLYKWFQQQVNHIEEMSKGQSTSETDLQSDGTSASLNIVQITKLANKFEDIKDRLKERTAFMQARQADKEILSESLKTYGLMEKQIEEFIKSHSALGSQTASETEPVTNRMGIMMKIFENQTTMLEKALTDQSVIESKYKEMETDFQMLKLEKTLLEGEIRRLREIQRAKAESKGRVKKSGKLEKKKDKDKGSERKISPNKEFKSFEELLQIQKEAEALKTEKKTLQEQLKWALEEAERNKTQLNYILHQKMDTFKEEKSKTKLDQALSKSKVKGEDSKDSLPKKSDKQSGGERQDQVREKLTKATSSDQSKRSVGERSEKRKAKADPSALEGFPPGTVKSLIEEHQESTLYKPNKKETWSTVSLPVLAEEMTDASEQAEAENIEVSFEMTNESPTEESDLLPEDQAPTMKQLAEKGRHKSLFISSKSPDTLTLISRTQSELENLEATQYENINGYEDQDKNFDKVSDRRRKSKGQKRSRTRKLPTHEEESDTLYYEDATKAKVPSKKLASDADGDEVLSPESQGSVSKAHTHPKKQRTPKRGRGSAHGEESDTVSYEEPTFSKVPSRRKGFAIPIKDHIEAHSSESQGSISKPDKETKEQSTAKIGRDSDADETFSPASQVSLLKADTETKKKRSSKRERTAVYSEESDTDVRLESQNVPSRSQVQLKKQKSLGGDIFTIHIAAPDESHTRLHQESTSKTQVQIERGTTSGTTRLTTQKKSATEVQEISESQTAQNPTISDVILHLDMDRVVENELENLKETVVQQVVRSNLEIGTDQKKALATSKSKEPMEIESKSKTFKIVNGMKLLGKLKDEHDESLGIKPQENMSDKYQPQVKSATKVTNLSPFFSKEKLWESTSVYPDEVPMPVNRRSRRSSVISDALQQLINRKTSGHMKPTGVQKQNAELKKHLPISVRSSHKYIHKGQSKHQKLMKQGAKLPSNIHPSTSTKYQKHKEPETIVENNVELDDNLVTAASPPNIKIIKELSTTLNLDGEDIQHSELLLKTASATKKPAIKVLSKSSNFDKEKFQDIHILHLSTTALMKLLFKEQAKVKSLEKKLLKGSNILYKSTSFMKKFLFEEPSETKKKRKKRKVAVKSTQHLPIPKTSTKKPMLKEKSEIRNLEKPNVIGTSILKKSASAPKKHILKGQPKPENVDKEVFDEPYNLNISSSPTKKQILKGQPKSENSDEKGFKHPNNLHISASSARKRLLKGKKITTLR